MSKEGLGYQRVLLLAIRYHWLLVLECVLEGGLAVEKEYFILAVPREHLHQALKSTCQIQQGLTGLIRSSCSLA